MNELLESLVCAGTECFCWILVLFNLLAVFYLVFCSFWKVSGLVKIFGWIQSGVLICVAIVTLFYHTCIYTLLATIFTGMMLMAIFSTLTDSSVLVTMALSSGVVGSKEKVMLYLPSFEMYRVILVSSEGYLPGVSQS